MPQRWPIMTQTPRPFGVAQGLSWAAIWAALDQTSKWAIVHGFGFAEREAYAVLPFLDFTFIWNPGMSYGLLDGSGDAGRWLLSLLAILAIGYFIWMLKAGETLRVGLAYALLAGGALGNLVDRLWYGAVVDFVSLHWNGFYWYVFNLADVWISLGVAVLIYDLIWPQKAAD